MAARDADGSIEPRVVIPVVKVCETISDAILRGQNSKANFPSLECCELLDIISANGEWASWKIDGKRSFGMLEHAIDARGDESDVGEGRKQFISGRGSQKNEVGIH